MRHLLLLLSAATAVLAQTGIEGRVIDATTHLGIPGVGVLLSGPDSQRYEATTDASGSFHLSNVSPRLYSAQLVAPDHYSPGGHPVFQAIPNQVVRPVFELYARASLSGRVLDEQGNPVPGSKVFLRSGTGSLSGVVSDSAGRFVHTGLQSDTYTLSGQPTGSSSADEFQAVETFFPNSMDEEHASRIFLAPGVKTDGFDIRLQRVPVFSIKGVIRDANGQPAEKIKVYVGRKTLPRTLPGTMGRIGSSDLILTFERGAEGLNPDSGDLQTTTTADNGTFELTGIPEGSWLLQAESEWTRLEGTDTDVQQVGFADAVIARRDALDIEIRLAKTFDMRAKVEIEGETTPSPDSFVSAILRPDIRGRYSFGMQDGASIQFKQVVPGRYSVSAGAFAGFSGLRLAATYLGSQNVTGIPVDLTESSPPMRLVFRKGVGTIEGTLNGNTPATVVVVPSAQSADGVIVAIDAAPGAKFQVPGLAPGSYTITAFDRIDGAILFAPATLEELRRLGSVLKVESDATTVVELRPTRWPGSF